MFVWSGHVFESPSASPLQEVYAKQKSSRQRPKIKSREKGNQKPLFAEMELNPQLHRSTSTTGGASGVEAVVGPGFAPVIGTIKGKLLLACSTLFFFSWVSKAVSLTNTSPLAEIISRIATRGSHLCHQSPANSSPPFPPPLSPSILLFLFPTRFLIYIIKKTPYALVLSINIPQALPKNCTPAAAGFSLRICTSIGKGTGFYTFITASSWLVCVTLLLLLVFKGEVVVAADCFAKTSVNYWVLELGLVASFVRRACLPHLPCMRMCVQHPMVHVVAGARAHLPVQTLINCIYADSRVQLYVRGLIRINCLHATR